MKQEPPPETRVDGDNTVEGVCQRFEASWKANQQPKMEDFLAGWEEPERSKLLHELLVLELELASLEGKTLTPSAYLGRFPEHQRVISEVFETWTASQTEQTQVSSDSTVVMRSQLSGLRLHAVGGLGMVYRAVDFGLRREIAVKFIRSTLEDNPDCRERFRTEAEITSRLEHPGVVPVYGFGGDDCESPFYAMRFIEGETMEDTIRRYHDPRHHAERSQTASEMQLRELLGRFVALCQTIAYAHNRGIVHRDIKPENVMLGRFGETIVIDWGLAMFVGRQGIFKRSNEKTLTPSSGSQTSGAHNGVAGTPAYMSPEQASGTPELTPASDIYSLGATLYKILVGRLPWTGDLPSLLTQIREGQFPPTRIDHHLPKPLEAICLKAMSLDPRDRYTTALDLAQDIENHLADAPVSVVKETASRRVARWTRRHRLLAQGLLVALLISSILGVSAAFSFSHLRSEAIMLQQREHLMRRHGLAVSAKFASRMIANKIDVRLRVLEKEAADPSLHSMLATVNLDPKEEESRKPLQAWLDERVSRYAEIDSRSWFVCSVDGSQVARFPAFDENGQRQQSLARNYRYRDYFHGQGMDFSDDFERPPLTEAQVSVALVSTNDGTLSIVFSAPIGTHHGEPIGVLGMAVELGELADLNIPLPDGQNVMLVDVRRYLLKDAEGARGEGLILHHEHLRDLVGRDTLPHLDDATIQRMQESKSRGDTAISDTDQANLLGAQYRDPVADDEDGPWLAAFAPVILSTRPTGAKVHDVGFFVIVQQQQR